MDAAEKEDNGYSVDELHAFNVYNGGLLKMLQISKKSDNCFEIIMLCLCESVILCIL